MWQIASPNGKFKVLLSQKQIDKLEKASLPNMIQPSKLQNKPYLKENKESKELIKQFKEEKTKSPTVAKYIRRKKREG